jgi:hypothetical protein
MYKMLIAGVLMLMLASVYPSALAHELYSVPDAMPHSAACRVWVDGEELAVIDTAVNLLRTWTSRPTTTTAPVTRFGITSQAELRVRFMGQTINSAVVRPLSLGIAPQIDGDTVSFTLDGPVLCTVEINGQQEGALHLFAETPDAEIPSGDNVLVYENGLHEIGTVELTDGQTVYLYPGAVVRGQFVAHDAQNISILGHGVIDGSAFHRWEQQTVPIDFSNCKNIQIADITILDPAAWTLNLYHCEDARIDCVKIIGARSNSDGITLQSCKNIAVQGCFVRGWDDNLVVKGYDGDVSNISFSDCILWTDLAQSCEIGYETRADVMENITFQNITVLHANHKPVLSIHNSDNALVRNVIFRNITVEDCNLGQGDGTEFLIDLTTTKSQWSKSQERGSILDVLIENVTVLSGKVPSVRIFAFSKDHTIDNITIRNLTLMGRKILSFDDLRYTESPRNNGKNIGIGP